MTQIWCAKSDYRQLWEPKEENMCIKNYRSERLINNRFDKNKSIWHNNTWSTITTIVSDMKTTHIKKLFKFFFNFLSSLNSIFKLFSSPFLYITICRSCHTFLSDEIDFPLQLFSSFRNQFAKALNEFFSHVKSSSICLSEWSEQLVESFVPYLWTCILSIYCHLLVPIKSQYWIARDICWILKQFFFSFTRVNELKIRVTYFRWRANGDY